MNQDPHIHVPHPVRDQRTRTREAEERRRMLRQLVHRAVSAVDFVELVDELGLQEELEELLKLSPARRIAVTKARRASELPGSFTMPDGVPDGVDGVED